MTDNEYQVINVFQLTKRPLHKGLEIIGFTESGERGRARRFPDTPRVVAEYVTSGFKQWIGKRAENSVTTL